MHRKQTDGGPRTAGLNITQRGRTALLLLLLAALGLAGLPAVQASTHTAAQPHTAGSVAAAWAWGADNNGQLGNGISSTQPYSVPAPVGAVLNAVAVAGNAVPGNSNTTSDDHGLALTSSGALWAWGDNHAGQLGNGTACLSFFGLFSSGCSSATPVQVSSFFTGDTATSGSAIAAGGNFDLALASGGALWAWGDNSYGELGTAGTGSGCAGTSNPCDTAPVQVPTPFLPSGVSLTALAAGTSHSLALDSSGHVWAWGRNNDGQIASTVANGSNIPLQVAGLSGITSIAAGGNDSFAVGPGGSVWAWGDNTSDQLGASTAQICGTNTPCSLAPVQVMAQVGTPTNPITAPLTGVVAVAAGSQHALALKSDGSLWAWGLNSSGQLGTSTGACALPGGSAQCSPIAIPVSLSLPAGVSLKAIAAGADHSLALASDGSVWAWGFNTDGQVGDGNVNEATTPVQVSEAGGFSGATAIAAGGNLSLAVAPGLPLSISPSTVDFGAVVEHTQSISQSVTLVNNSPAAVTINSIVLTQPSTYLGLGTPPFADNLQGCQGANAVLQPNGSCTVYVTYTPAGTGQSAGGSLTFNDTAVGSPQGVPLTGSGVATNLTPNPTSITFPATAVGTTSGAQTVTVSNPGPGSASVGAVSVSQPFSLCSILGCPVPAPFGIASDTCQGQPLPAGTSCTIGVTYTPGGTGTSPGGSLVIADGSSGGTISVPLGGSGVAAAPGSVSLSATSLDFGTVAKGTTSSAQSVQITNNGSSSVTINSVTASNPNLIGGPNPFDVSGSCTAGLALPNGATCVINVTYTPAYSGLPADATLTIVDTAAGSPQTVTLSGVGAKAPTDTPTSTATAAPPATATPAATQTPIPAPAVQPTSQPAPIQPTAVPTQSSGGASHHNGHKQKKHKTTHHHGPALSVKITPARVTSGGILSIHIHTLAHAKITSALQVTRTTVTYKGKGKHRKKIVHTTVLSGVALDGHTDSHGNFDVRVRIAYKPSRPTLVHLTVTAHTSKGTATGSAQATILPPLHGLSLQTIVKPALLAAGGRLTVAVKTAAHAQVEALLRVVTTRTVVTGKGKHRKRVTHTVVLYHVSLLGHTDAHGHFKGSVRVTYKPAHPVRALLTITAHTTSGSGSRTDHVTIRP